jgi:hypothetical protein
MMLFLYGGYGSRLGVGYIAVRTLVFLAGADLAYTFLMEFV